MSTVLPSIVVQAVAASASSTAFPQHALLNLSAAKKPASVAMSRLGRQGAPRPFSRCVESV